jgi:SAM-dependent methyltransferase
MSFAEKGPGGFAATHWNHIYSSKRPDQMSWTREHLDTSLEWIEKAAPDRASSIIDVGGGISTLSDDLLAMGYHELTVLDISQAALAVLRGRLGEKVNYLAGDILAASLPAHHYDLWHDRAVFHFLTEASQRARYVEQVKRSVKPGGHVLIATFGNEGPEKCSGLPVQRYDAQGLHREFGASFELQWSRTEVHSTPFGSQQQFLYCYCTVQAS